VLYQVRDSAEKTKPLALFTGDTLFIGGCGRFMEGTADQMYHALLEVIAVMPGDTEIYCGHEYTVKNLSFAKTLEPNNQDLLDKLEWATKQRAQSLSTVPSTVAEEMKFNPFMRVNQATVAASVGLTKADGPIEVMKKVRALKDKW